MFGVWFKGLCRLQSWGKSAREEEKCFFLKVQFRIYKSVRCILQNSSLQRDIDLKLKFVISYAYRINDPLSVKS